MQTYWPYSSCPHPTHHSQEERHTCLPFGLASATREKLDWTPSNSHRAKHHYIKQRLAMVRVLHLVKGAEGMRTTNHLMPRVIPIDMVCRHHTPHLALLKTAIPREAEHRDPLNELFLVFYWSSLLLVGPVCCDWPDSSSVWLKC